MTPEQLEQILPLLIGTILIEGGALTILSYLVLKSRGEPPVIEEVFTIYNDGRLISHVSTAPYPDSDEIPDEDIFTSMLTVVQTFIEDSFHSRDETDLKKLEFGNKSIYFKAGKYLNLAVLFTGDATDKMSARISGTLNTMEEKYMRSLEDWDGELEKLHGMEDFVKPLLGRHAR
ncbi:MAG: hypothetical protein JSW28_00090 [Thermoplasmata archaeon]|nr:MAG: hypothetical protein JSW28_00090 [Thermoplasmata archaeon]